MRNRNKMRPTVLQYVKWSKRALRKQDGPGVRSNAAKDRKAKKDAAYDFANDSGLPEFASDPPKKKSGQQHCRHLQKQQCHTDF